MEDLIYNTNRVCKGLCTKGIGRQDRQLNTYDWLADIPGNELESQYVEVQFKNTRKGYFRNSNGLQLQKGDIVAVEASPGHDIGVVTLTGRLVPLQMKKTNIRSEADIKRVYRKARQTDMEKYYEAKAREHSTMIEARQIALDLHLQMKIGDVEYQGDGNKAIFYYIADERVDFRQLIKVLAEAFRVRIEMKQIGARQEAGRIGGIGPCGRELCCATWMTSFVSVSTGAARIQDIFSALTPDTIESILVLYLGQDIFSLHPFHLLHTDNIRLTGKYELADCIPAVLPDIVPVSGLGITYVESANQKVCTFFLGIARSIGVFLT